MWKGEFEAISRCWRTLWQLVWRLKVLISAVTIAMHLGCKLAPVFSVKCMLWVCRIASKNRWTINVEWIFFYQRNIIQKCGWFSIRFDSQRASAGCILHYYMCSHVERQILVLFPTTLWDFSGDFELSPWLRVHDPWDLSWLFWNLKFDESFEIYISPIAIAWGCKL